LVFPLPQISGTRTSAVSAIQQARNNRSSGARNDGYLSTLDFLEKGGRRI